MPFQYYSTWSNFPANILSKFNLKQFSSKYSLQKFSYDRQLRFCNRYSFLDNSIMCTKHGRLFAAVRPSKSCVLTREAIITQTGLYCQENPHFSHTAIHFAGHAWHCFDDSHQLPSIDLWRPKHWISVAACMQSVSPCTLGGIVKVLVNGNESK